MITILGQKRLMNWDKKTFWLEQHTKQGKQNSLLN
jgi:hypothetical protein